MSADITAFFKEWRYSYHDRTTRLSFYPRPCEPFISANRLGANFNQTISASRALMTPCYPKITELGDLSFYRCWGLCLFLIIVFTIFPLTLEVSIKIDFYLNSLRCAPTVASPSFERRNTTHRLRFGLPNLLCDTSRLLRLSPFTSGTEIRPCVGTLGLNPFRFFYSGFVGLVWNSVVPPTSDYIPIGSRHYPLFIYGGPFSTNFLLIHRFTDGLGEHTQ